MLKHSWVEVKVVNTLPVSLNSFSYLCFCYFHVKNVQVISILRQVDFIISFLDYVFINVRNFSVKYLIKVTILQVLGFEENSKQTVLQIFVFC